MRWARVDVDGFPLCRACGGAALMAKSSERHKRIQHLKCEHCGERQRYRQRKLMVNGIDRDPEASQDTPM